MSAIEMLRSIQMSDGVISHQKFRSWWITVELACYVKTIFVFFINFTTSFARDP